MKKSSVKSSVTQQVEASLGRQPLVSDGDGSEGRHEEPWKDRCLSGDSIDSRATDKSRVQVRDDFECLEIEVSSSFPAGPMRSTHSTGSIGSNWRSRASTRHSTSTSVSECESVIMPMSDITFDNNTATFNRSKSLYHRARYASVDESNRLLSELELTSKQILHGTPASVPLSGFGRLLRSTVGSALAQGTADDLYHLSMQVDHIDTFWSHSWHASAWQKAATLLIIYNRNSAVVGSLLGVVFVGLFQCWYHPAQSELSSLSSLLFGVIGFFMGLCLPRPNDVVFLDKICISQTDPRLKDDGIRSIGGFLRSSRNLMILWDPTYLSRLWCVFELGAFSFVKKLDPHKKITLTPIFHGGMVIFCIIMYSFTLVIFKVLFYGIRIWHWDETMIGIKEWSSKFAGSIAVVTTCFIGARVICPIAEAALRMDGQLADFAVDKAECFCCSNRHVHPDTGAKLGCDRKVVEKSVKRWFGDTNTFNLTVRNELPKSFGYQVVGLPYRLALLCSLPILWLGLGRVAWMLRRGYPPGKVYDSLMEVFTLYFTIYPIFVELMWRPALWWKQRCAQQWLNQTFISCISSTLGFILWICHDHVSTSADQCRKDLACGAARARSYALIRLLVLALATIFFYRSRSCLQQPFRR